MKKINTATMIMAVILFACLAYLLAYSTSKYWYPNSADGPGPVYDSAFAPLNETSVADPPY